MEPSQPPSPSPIPTLSGVAHAVTGASGEAHVVPWVNFLVVVLLVLANGFFVASEFALVAVRRSRIDQLAAEGSSAAAVVQRAVHDLDRYIAATQVGITIASLVLGGVGEHTFHTVFEPFLALIGIPEDLRIVSRAGIASGLAYFVMTALHVVIGELMPKSIALQSAESTALVIARPMVFFGKLFAPLIWLLNGTGGFLLRRLGISSVEGHGQVHSPEELDILVKQSHRGGELNDTEAEILHRVVRFSDLTLREVMVPRVEVQALALVMPRLALRAYIQSKPHSRVPVYHSTLDEVIGVVHLKDLVPFAAKLPPGEDDTPVNLKPIVREPLRVPETSTVDKLLLEFKKLHQQMAIVIDEFGGTAGIVTLGDLMEQVFGTVGDEFDGSIEEITETQDGRVIMPGRTLIDIINERYETDFDTDEVDTMAGLVLDALGRPARVGDEVTVDGSRLRVENVERLAITRLSLEPKALSSARQGSEHI